MKAAGKTSFRNAFNVYSPKIDDIKERMGVQYISRGIVRWLQETSWTLVGMSLKIT